MDGFPLFPTGRVGPAEEPREAASAFSFGVPGPREDWRSEEDWAGMERWWFSRLRFEGSVDGERLVPRMALMAAAAAAGGRPAVLRGEGWRAEGCTRRARLLFAIVVEGPALPERG